MKLSVIVPVYNERGTIATILETLKKVSVDKEIIVVDDGSTDGTRGILAGLDGRDGIRVVFHEKNCGKGRAVRTGIGMAAGDAVIIQDADLEYNPMDYKILLDALSKTQADVVYGSRFLSGRKVTSAWHRLVNYTLTTLTNILFGSKLTDMETCYKLFKRPIIRDLRLESEGFEVEVELTAKLLKRGAKIVEVPISYNGRSYHEGKKIGWQDGFKAVFYLFCYRLSGK